MIRVTVLSGRKNHGTDGRVAVSAPAGSLCSSAHRAARHRGRVERFLGRPGGAQVKLAVSLEQDKRRPRKARMDRGDRGLGNIVEGGDAGEPARELVETARRPHAAHRHLRLIAHPSRQRRDDHCDGEEDGEGEQLVRFGDRERVERLDEKQVVGQKRQHRRINRRPDAERHGREHNRHQEDHGEVGKRRELRQHVPDRDRRGDRDRRPDVRRDIELRPAKIPNGPPGCLALFLRLVIT